MMSSNVPRPMYMQAPCIAGGRVFRALRTGLLPKGRLS